MRYSKQTKLNPIQIKSTASAKTFVASIEKGTTVFEREGGLLLVGGTSPRNIEVRRAQSFLRWDRSPSTWSHAAVLLRWPNNATPRDLVGAEISLEPANPQQQVPERGGVTLFRGSDYANRERYPHLAFATLCRRKGLKKSENDKVTHELKGLKEKIQEAALNPNKDRVRYPFWNWTAVWSGYAMNPESRANPLLEAIPHPGAAFCEYVYGAAGIDLTPGALEPNAAPEVLWSTLKFWHESVEGLGCELKVWTLGERDVPPRREPLEGQLEDEYAEMLKG